MSKISLNDGDTRLLIKTGHEAGLLRNQMAAVLAQVRWETAQTMKPVREYGGETYLKSKKYYPYVGMGHIQLTWRENYVKASKELGVDFVADPKKLLNPAYSAHIAVIGMRDGWFTGKRLDTYITLTRSDYFNSRSIVNGDKTKVIPGNRIRIGDQIAIWGKEYNELLRLDGWDRVVQAPVDTTKPAVDNGPSGWERFKAWISALFAKKDL